MTPTDTPAERILINIDLTPRQREVVSLLSTGLLASEVAKQLSISTLTARKHIKNAQARTNSKNAVHLCVRWALGEI